MDISDSERTEKPLDSLIERRHDHRQRTVEEERVEELWQSSVRAHNARQAELHRLAWCEHYRKMRGVHWGLGDDYDRKLRELENGHKSEEGRNGHQDQRPRARVPGAQGTDTGGQLPQLGEKGAPDTGARAEIR